MSPIRKLASCLLLVLVFGCDRNIEPFVPGEEPSEPDLSKIFPEGAERSAQAQPSMPPAPRGIPPVADAGAEGAGGDAAPVRGTLRLAEGLEAPAGAIGFLIARRGAGGPPLAVKRIAELSFPREFELGPGDRMIASVPFAGPLTLTFRVDADGNATSRDPGDLQGAAAAPVDVGATGVEILIDEVL
jgi:hypothetical protein